MKMLSLFAITSLLVVAEVVGYSYGYGDFPTSMPNTNSTNSEDVLTRVRTTLDNDPTLMRNGNTIQASIDSSNRVTLTGIVRQPSDKRRAETLVRGMRGVKTVNNNINISQ